MKSLSPTFYLRIGALLLLAAGIYAFKPSSSNAEKKKVLIVCTSVDSVNHFVNGTYLVELAAPIYLLNKAGIAFDIVSPKGQAIPVYHKGDTSQFLKQAVRLSVYQDKTKHSLKPEALNVLDYTAVIIPGGYGQFWDLHQNKTMLQAITKIYENGGLLGTIGHGTSTLSFLTLKNGSYLVKKATLTCFPSWFEKQHMKEADYGRLLPFDMEKALQKRGAQVVVVSNPPTGKHVYYDSTYRLVTAAFANDADYVANTVIDWFLKN